MVPLSVQVFVFVVLVSAAVVDSVRAEIVAGRERRLSAACRARILAYVAPR